MPESCCYPVPEDLSIDDAVLCEPLSIGLYAVKLSIRMEGAAAGVIGAGPIGLSVLLCAGAYGCERTYVSDPVPARHRSAGENGALWAGTPEELDEAVRQGEPDLLDVAFECSGTQDGLDQALRLLKPGGKLMIIGIPEFDRFGFDAHTARRHEITLQNVRRQNECVDESMKLVAEGKIDPSFMKTHEFSLDEAPRAFTLIRSYSDGVIKPFVTVP
jgi:threonine dehydrogenase-like Zn-dependent dehydrogenase